METQDLTSIERAAYRRIRNALVHGLKPPTTRELSALLGYKSPRSGSLIINRLIAVGLLCRDATGKLLLLRDTGEGKNDTETVGVPLIGCAPCGGPLLAEENIEATIPVSTNLVPAPYKYFVLRARGNSMDQKGIKDGDLVLVRQQGTALEGDTVVALINDEATIKEFHHPDRNTVILTPRSSDSSHQPIILTADLQIQGIVLRSFSATNPTERRMT